MNDSLAVALLAIVGDTEEAEEMRAKAAIGLGAVLEDCDTTGFDDPLGYDEPSIAELTFHRIRTTLQKLYEDPGVPKLVRRRILEAAVRSPQDWHRDAIRKAYASGDREWVLMAAGNSSVDAAWDHVAALVEDPTTQKNLRLAALRHWAPSGRRRPWRFWSI